MNANARSAKPLLLLAASLAATSACAYANGYDPARYASAAPAASVDQEIESLPRSPRLRLRDPRGVPVFDAGARAPIELMALNAAATPTPTPTPTPTLTPTLTGADAGAPTVAEAQCGTKTDPCAMQRFMRGAMETAHTADRLVAAFTRVAGMSPDPAWSWVTIARRGADLANAGNLQAAKAQCQACHDVYREPYKTLHRTRKL